MLEQARDLPSPSDLQYVKTKLSLQVCRGPRAYVTLLPYFPRQLRIENRDSVVCGLRMADRVHLVMSQRAERKGLLLRIARFGKQPADEVACANIVQQIREQTTAKWKIPQIS